MLPEYRITAGFMPLTDCLLMVIAREKGFAAEEGVELTLVRETSWANIRDRVAVGHFDVAHMLAPMVVAASLGLTPISAPVIAPFALGLGGNAVTVSTALWAQMLAVGAPGDLAPGPVGKALARVVASTDRRLRFAVVHPHSGHNYELRYWLSASGIEPDRQIEIVVVPPPLVADALAAGRLDGFCVGEPWNSVAVARGTARIATVKAAIWPLSPEKVLGVTEDWSTANPNALSALLRALYRAAQWCGMPANHIEAASILSRSEYLDVAAAEIWHALSGKLALGGGATQTVQNFFVPLEHHATLPSVAQAAWFYTQIVRLGDVVHSPEHLASARRSFRPDLYRKALDGIVTDLPSSDVWPSGAESFFDGTVFDPDDIESYIARQLP